MSSLLNQPQRAVEATRDLGLTWLRATALWKVVEPNPGAYDWSTLDSVVQAARGSGVSVLATIRDAPTWARGANDSPGSAGPPQDPATLAGFAGALAARYCNTPVRAVQILNEPNLSFNWNNEAPSPAGYMQVLSAAYQAVKQACPSMVVVSAAPSPTGAPMPIAMDDVEYLKGLYANGLATTSDVVGIRLPGYDRGPDAPADNPTLRSFSFLSTLKSYRNLRAQNGGPTFWVTEFGWAAGPSTDRPYAFANNITRELQGEWTVRAFEMLRGSGEIGAAFLWLLDAAPSDPNNPVSMWSMVDQDWNPYPVYVALQQMEK